MIFFIFSFPFAWRIMQMVLEIYDTGDLLRCNIAVLKDITQITQVKIIIQRVSSGFLWWVIPRLSYIFHISISENVKSWGEDTMQISWAELAQLLNIKEASDFLSIPFLNFQFRFFHCSRLHYRKFMAIRHGYTRYSTNTHNVYVPWFCYAQNIARDLCVIHKACKRKK